MNRTISPLRPYCKIHLASMLSKPSSKKPMLAGISNLRRRYASNAQPLRVRETLEETESLNDVEKIQQIRKQNAKRLRLGLRYLLREIAQPVAVVTSFMPGTTSLPSSRRDTPNPDIYHGATLSSFTSVAMDPYPLVTFALRIPSRMASSLSSLSEPQLSSSSSSSTAHMVVNFLSSSQQFAAVKFSRPDLYPTPFQMSGTENMPYTLTEEGLPIIDDAIGAISCQVIGRPIPLYDLEFLERIGATPKRDIQPVMPSLEKGEVASELFVARVLRVEKVRHNEGGMMEERTSPLIYHRQSYTSCSGSKS